MDEMNNVTFNEEELNNALAASEEMVSEVSNENTTNVVVEEPKEEVAPVVEETNDIKPAVGDYVKLEKAEMNQLMGLDENVAFRLIDFNAETNDATVVKVGEEQTQLFFPYDLLVKTEYVNTNDNTNETTNDNNNSFNFSDTAEAVATIAGKEEKQEFIFNKVEEQKEDTTSFAFNDGATSVSGSLPLEYNEYKPSIEPEEREDIYTIEPAEIKIAPVVEENVEEKQEVIAEERGSKPIRWSTKFVDKIRSKREIRAEEKAKENAAKEAERIQKEKEAAEKLAEETIRRETEKAAMEEQKEAERIAKEEEKARIEKEKQEKEAQRTIEKETKKAEKEAKKAGKETKKEAKKEELKGKLVMFKTSLGDKKAKLAAEASNKWTKMTNNINDKKEDKKQEKAIEKAKKTVEKETKKAEKVSKKEEKAKEKATKKAEKESKKVEETVKPEEKEVEKVVLEDSVMSFVGSANPYDFYASQPEEVQREIINNIIESIKFMQDEKSKAENKVKFAEDKLGEATDIIAKQNDTIKEALKANVVAENVETPVEEETEIKPVEITPDVPTQQEENVFEQLINEINEKEDVKETEEVETKDEVKESNDLEKAKLVLEHVQSGDYNFDQAVGRADADLVYEKLEAEKAEWEKARQELIEQNRENSENAKQKQAEIAEELFKKEREDAIDRYRSEGLSYKQAIEKWNLEQEQKEADSKLYEQNKLEQTQDDFIDIVRKKTDYSIDEAVEQWNVRQEEESRKIR